MGAKIEQPETLQEQVCLGVHRSATLVHIKNEAHDIRISWMMASGRVTIFRPRLDVVWRVYGLDTSDEKSIDGVSLLGYSPCCGVMRAL